MIPVVGPNRRVGRGGYRPEPLHGSLQPPPRSGLPAPGQTFLHPVRPYGYTEMHLISKITYHLACCKAMKKLLVYE
jgi:hypothetical protein